MTSSTFRMLRREFYPALAEAIRKAVAREEPRRRPQRTRPPAWGVERTSLTLE